MSFLSHAFSDAPGTVPSAFSDESSQIGAGAVRITHARHAHAYQTRTQASSTRERGLLAKCRQSKLCEKIRSSKNFSNLVGCGAQPRVFGVRGAARLAA